jgi:DNA repair exonuclease SbcCD nuclease subunit
MKICILGDTHHGMRGDSIPFHNLYRKFYQEIFFPYLIQNNIDTVFQLGDLFDRRKYIGFQTLALSRKYFFDPMQEAKIKLSVLLGNHDITFKNTLEVNSPQLLLNEYNNITIHDKATTVELENTSIDIIPWICSENESEINEFIKASSSQICFGHFELAGFEMDKGNVCHEGMDRKTLNKYDVVLSGHFHHKSSDGTITYVGTPGQMTWADYGDKRGFHIFDTETRELQFIENTYVMFHKIMYDDKSETLESVSTRDFSQYKDRIVKVIVANKTNPVIYDIFLDNLYKAGPIDVSVVEDFTDYSEITDDDIVDQSEDTTTILDKVIDSLELDLDKSKLKNVMREIYLEAQSLETK